MSYILEALKKSEKERNKEGVPNLYTNHSPSARRVRQRKKPLIKWTLAGAALLAVAAGAVFAWQQRQPEVVMTVGSPPALVTPAPKPVPVAAPVPVAPPAASIPAAAKVPKVVPAEVVREREKVVIKDIPPPSVSQSEPEAVAAVQLKEEPAVVVAPSPALPTDADYPLLEELSLSIRNRVPDLHFAGHVYSESSSDRMIIINNRIVREGDLVGDGLALQRITREGVVMQFEDSVFKVILF